MTKGCIVLKIAHNTRKPKKWKGAKDMNYMEAKYSLTFHFIWTIVYKGLPAKYNASSEVQQNVGVAHGTVGQRFQSKVKGFKVAGHIPINEYSTDGRNMIQKIKKGSDTPEKENCKKFKWTEQKYKATMNLHYFSA